METRRNSHHRKQSKVVEASASATSRKKRPAYTLTCLTCRKRKMRCDGKTPSCSMCASSEIDCHYDRPPPMSQVYAMARRLQELETRLSGCQQGDNAVAHFTTTQNLISASRVANDIQQEETADSPNSRDAVDGAESYQTISQISSPGIEDLSTAANGQLSYHGRTSAIHEPISSSVLRTAHRRSRLAQEKLTFDAAESRGWESFSLQSGALLLGIDRVVMETLLKTHWSWIHPVFMFVYRPAFMNDMGSGGMYWSEFLSVTLCAHSTRFVRKDIAVRLLNRARLLAGQQLQFGSSITAIQGFLQLSAREVGEGSVSQAWLYSGIAFRMAVDLGLFMNQKYWANLSLFTGQDQEIRQRLAWSCYFWDKAMSLYLGRVPALLVRPAHEPNFLDESGEVELWSPYFMEANHEHDSVSQDYPPRPARFASTFANSCRLAVIVNDVILTVYSGRLEADETQRRVRDIQQRLRIWRRNTPGHLKLDPECLPESSPPPHIVTQNLLYYAVVILLHRPLNHVSASRIASQQASRAIEAMLLLYESTFGLSHVTYLMTYCTYTAATVAVEDQRDNIFGSYERAMTCLRTLERASIACPAIQLSIGIIKRRISTPEQDLAAPAQQLRETKLQQWTGMPAFPFQPYPMEESESYLSSDLMAGIWTPNNNNLLNPFPLAFTDFTGDEFLSEIQP